MSKKPNNPDWKDLLAPFAWLVTRILFFFFRKRWAEDPKIPVTKNSPPEQESDQ